MYVLYIALDDLLHQQPLVEAETNFDSGGHIVPFKLPNVEDLDLDSSISEDFDQPFSSSTFTDTPNPASDLFPSNSVPVLQPFELPVANQKLDDSKVDFPKLPVKHFSSHNFATTAIQPPPPYDYSYQSTLGSKSSETAIEPPPPYEESHPVASNEVMCVSKASDYVEDVEDVEFIDSVFFSLPEPSLLPELRLKMAELDIVNSRLHEMLYGQPPSTCAVDVPSDDSSPLVSPLNASAPVVPSNVSSTELALQDDRPVNHLTIFIENSASGTENVLLASKKSSPLLDIEDVRISKPKEPSKIEPWTLNSLIPLPERASSFLLNSRSTENDVKSEPSSAQASASLFDHDFSSPLISSPAFLSTPSASAFSASSSSVAAAAAADSIGVTAPRQETIPDPITSHPESSSRSFPGWLNKGDQEVSDTQNDSKRLLDDLRFRRAEADRLNRISRIMKGVSHNTT